MGSGVKKLLLTAVLVCGALAADEVPFSAIRLRKPQTDNPETWKATLAAFAKHRAGVDEVWFSTGISIPPMAEHRASAKRLAAAAEDLRKIGILPSLQIQTTIGHGDHFTRYMDNRGLAWQRYVASDGTVAESLNCFRAPGFIAYMRESAAVYAAAMKPYSIWIDDDIRIVHHHGGAGGDSGWGCHCDYCLAQFAKKEGKARDRKTLIAEMKRDPALAARWRAFAFEGEAALARAIGEAVHAASPTTRMCQQQPGACYSEHRLLYDTHHQVTGLPVGMRPGAGSYYDHDPRSQISKAYTLALQIDTIGRQPYFDRICPEIESCPRSFACRTGRGVLLEAIECLAQGMNSISALIMDAEYETPDWYGDNLLAPLARNSLMLKRFVKLAEGARRDGYGVRGMPDGELQTSSLPLYPFVEGVRPRLARIVRGHVARCIVSMGEKTVRYVLAEDLLMDGDAAAAFVGAGYGAELGLVGCKKFTGNLRDLMCEHELHAGFSARETPVSGASYFLQPAKGTTVLGEYVPDGMPSERKGVSTTAFENAKGRRRVVFGYDAFGGGLVIASGDRVRQLHRLADWASHGKSAIVFDTPLRAFVQPLVREDGSFAVCAIVNATIDFTEPVKVKVRGVQSGKTTAVWASLDCPEVKLPIRRVGAEVFLTLPPIPSWSGGYLYFQ